MEIRGRQVGIIHIVRAVLYLAVLVACILAIIFEAKADSEVGDEIDIVEDGEDVPSGEYIGGVDGWVHFVVFTGVFGVLSLLGLFIAEWTRKMWSWGTVIILFFNWAFFLSAFALLANGNVQDMQGCNYAIGELYTAGCLLPRACLGIDVIVWILLSICLAEASISAHRADTRPKNRRSFDPYTFRQEENAFGNTPQELDVRGKQSA